MMTPEQQQAFRASIRNDAISGVAVDRIVVAVESLLAAERAAERERCAKVCHNSIQSQGPYFATLIRAQGGGK